MGVAEGIDPNQLSQTGWGVIFHADENPAIRDALYPLLELRQQQAGAYYREFSGQNGCRTGESKNEFLKRFGRGPGPADPNLVPYYLLLVGDPEKISFTFQYQLDVQYAVGRLSFDTLEEYAEYARRVVAAETNVSQDKQKLSIFAPSHLDDVFTKNVQQHLVAPLCQTFGKNTNIVLNILLKQDATKKALDKLFDDTSILFIAAHGVAFPADFPDQQTEQGAILCADWPGPKLHKGPLPKEFYYSGLDYSHVNRGARLVIAHSSYSAGTPITDIFTKSADGGIPAHKPFISHLAKRLLGQPDGRTLAFIGMYDRVWSYSYPTPELLAESLTFETLLEALLNYRPVGAATEYINERYTEISTKLTETLDSYSFSQDFDETLVSSQWASNMDARSMILLGDPAIRV